jgi:type II secretory pathway pseudopilin PulG
MIRLRTVLQSSKAAIDLASIMVGIIVIGLIGGVIAATVFAVIPWSQDKAAKHQLESIHTAENALFGLSADPSTALQGGVGANTFTNSDGLAANSLLIKNPNYCVVHTKNGKDYMAFSKSASGKIWSAKNSKKTPVVYTATILPCTADGAYDPAIGGTSPNLTYTPLATWTFENSTESWWHSGAANNEVRTTSPGHDSTYSLGAFTNDQGTPFSMYIDKRDLVVGQNYRLSGWIRLSDDQTAAAYAQVGAVKSNFATATGWTKVSMEFTATKTTERLAFYSTPASKFTMQWLYVDDVKLESITD